MRNAIIPLLILSSSAFLEGQSAVGRLNVTLVNGTTGGRGEAESVNLFKLGSATPVANASNVSGQFALEDIELDGAKYLLQIQSGGASYSHVIDFGPGTETKTTVTVYDVTRDRNALEIKSARYLLRSDGNRLRVEKLYVIVNQSRPRKTYYDPKGTFRFHVPQNILGSSSVYVSSTSGTPMPQSFSALPDGSGYVTWPAFMPGTTDLTVTFDVDFSSGAFHLEERAFYDTSQMLVLITPSDLDLQARGWENQTANPGSRYLVLKQTDLPSGAPIDLTLTGSGRPTPSSPVAAGSVSPVPVTGGGAGIPHGTITQLPDPSSPQKWIIITLMAAALAYGLLAALMRKPQVSEKADA